MEQIEINYSGEFGYELIGVIPYAYYLHTKNSLKSTTSSKDTKCLYYFSKQHYELYPKRRYQDLSNFPFGNIHKSFLDKSQWIPPPYKKIYKNNLFRFTKPLCIVSNKYNKEWGGPPVNYLDIDTLTNIFSKLTGKYQIVYNRPKANVIVEDDNQLLDFDDFEMIKNEFKNIILLHELSENFPNYSFNTLQMMLYANARRFISVQGGNSVLASYFGGKNCIYAVQGGELEVDSYRNWYSEFSNAKIEVFHDYESLIKYVFSNNFNKI